MTLPPDPVAAVRILATALLSPNHSLYLDMLQEGLLAYYEFIRENDNATKNL